MTRHLYGNANTVSIIEPGTAARSRRHSGHDGHVLFASTA